MHCEITMTINSKCVILNPIVSNGVILLTKRNEIGCLLAVDGQKFDVDWLLNQPNYSLHICTHFVHGIVSNTASASVITATFTSLLSQHFGSISLTMLFIMCYIYMRVCVCETERARKSERMKKKLCISMQRAHHSIIRLFTMHKNNHSHRKFK